MSIEYINGRSLKRRLKQSHEVSSKHDGTSPQQIPALANVIPGIPLLRRGRGRGKNTTFAQTLFSFENTYPSEC